MLIRSISYVYVRLGRAFYFHVFLFSFLFLAFFFPPIVRSLSIEHYLSQLRVYVMGVSYDTLDHLLPIRAVYCERTTHDL